jgi:hypothetical protein
VLEFRTIRQEEVITRIETGKEEVKSSLFADYMILYLKTERLYQNTLRSDKHFWQNSKIQNQHPKTSSLCVFQ